MIVLGIESSCDETAAAVVQDGKFELSSVVMSQIKEHEIYGGVVPEIASRSHAENIGVVVSDALKKAGLSFDDLDAVAVTYTPGLIGALLVGVNFAKGIAFAKNKPLIPVHHLRGHIAANYITNKELKPPFLCLVVSGGHSHIVEVKDYTDMNIIGRTLDDAAGETFDKAARAMGIGYPGGVKLDKIAELGNALAFEFPKPKVKDQYNFSFSGLKTNVINKIHNIKQKSDDIPVNDLAASLRKTVVDYLCEKFFLAAENLGYNTLVIAGGVSANILLRRTLKEYCDKNNKQLFMPELRLCADNASMIAAQGYYEYIKGNTADLNLNAYATMPIDNPTF